MKNYQRLMLGLIITVMFNLSSFAQFQLGANPTGQNWKMVTSPSVRVIYPNGMEAKAQRIAKIINYIDVNNRRSIGTKKRRLDMVLQNQTVNPNGYVTVAPFRSEFYCTPPASNILLGSLDWLDVLAIHEYRHVLQSLNQRRGIVNLLYWLQGESLWGVANNLVIPNWVSEGDAVISETSLSNGGRGRSAFFTLEQRGLAYANKNYSYTKNRNDSFDENMPDHYRLGYMMLSKARNDKGNDIVAKILKEASSFKGIIYPYSQALRRNIGYGSKGLYKASWEESKKKFAEQVSNADLIANTKITKEFPGTFTSYRFPRIDDQGTIYVRKTSFKKTTEIVSIQNGKEKNITTIGFGNDDWLHYSNGKLAWAELTKNARRDNMDFSDVVIYDLTKKDKIRLTKHTKYFSPTISPDGKTLAAINVSAKQENEIHILDISNGNIISKMSTPKNYFLSRLSWTEDGSNIVTIAKENSQLAVIKIDLGSKEIVELTPWSTHTMEAPVVKGDKVFFNASYTGIDNIYSTDLRGSKNIYQESSVPVGAFESAVSNDGNSLYFSEYNHKGYHISKQDISSGRSKSALSPQEPVNMSLYDNVANKEEGGNILNKIGNQSYPTKSYSSLFKGMKLHTWGISPSISNPSLRISMINLLRDAELSASGTLNRNENNALSYNTSLRIARYYPDITIGASRGARNTELYTPADTLSTLNFNETSLRGSMSIPLSWMKGNYRTAFEPSVGLVQRKLSNLKNNENPIFQNTDISELQVGLSFSSLRRKAYQNLASRMGFSLDASFNKSLGSTDAEKMYASSTLFLPGLGKNHSLKFGASYQQENLKNLYQFSDEFTYARGFLAPLNDNYKMVTANYTFPLLYPDFGIAGITYFKRISMNLFYDYGVAQNKKLNTTSDYNSAGFELLFDNVMLNLLPIRAGIRQSYKLNDPTNSTKKTKFELFVTTDF